MNTGGQSIPVMLSLDLSKTTTKTGMVQLNHGVGPTFSISRNQHTNFHSDQIKFTLSPLGYKGFCARIFLKSRTDTMCVCVHMCVYIYTYVYAYTYMCVHTRVCTHSGCTHTFVHAYTYM